MPANPTSIRPQPVDKSTHSPAICRKHEQEGLGHGRGTDPAHLRAVPNLRPLRIWLLRMGAVALIFSLQRVLFALLNHEAFPAPPPAES